jgi:hypothetical protein
MIILAPTMLPVVIACLMGGIAFAALAVWLTQSKGNTLKDVLNSEAFRNKPPESLQIEIDHLQNKFKASAQMPIVAMWVIAGLVAVGLPVLMVLRQDSSRAAACEEGEITLTGKIKKGAQGNVYLVPTDLRVEPSGFFRIPLKANDPKRDYNIESESFLPVTLNVDYVKKDGKLYVNWADAARDTLRVDTARNTAELSRPIELPPRAAAAANQITPSGPGNAPAPSGPQEFEAFE